LPAPVSSRSITNLGILLSSGWARAHAALSRSRMRCRDAPVVRRKPSPGDFARGRDRDSCPGLNGQPPRAKPGVAGAYDRLVAMLDLNLVEDPRDVIADRLLRQAERACDLGVVEPLAIRSRIPRRRSRGQDRSPSSRTRVDRYRGPTGHSYGNRAATR